MTDSLFRYLTISYYLTVVVESQNIKSTKPRICGGLLLLVVPLAVAETDSSS